MKIYEKFENRNITIKINTLKFLLHYLQINILIIIISEIMILWFLIDIIKTLLFPIPDFMNC
jgi:hypothetical protein